MPRAELGSTKQLNNQLKSKGLQRLRWYCQVCEKQCRDANGFKMHTQSESHVRQMLLVGENAKKFISDYSSQFQRDFLLLLRTSHGEKQVHMNHFYQEYIHNKEHIHMNATRWLSLTEFAKHLGREGICRVEETEKGLHIAWIDNSPEALRRQDAIRKKERQDKGDENREQALIREQVRRAKADAEARGQEEIEDDMERELKREEGEKIKLNFAPKSTETKGADAFSPMAVSESSPTIAPVTEHLLKTVKPMDPVNPSDIDSTNKITATTTAMTSDNPIASKVSLKMSANHKPKNVFAAAKKNLLGTKKATVVEQPKKMSEAERIMKEEIERKRSAAGLTFRGPPNKRSRV